MSLLKDFRLFSMAVALTAGLFFVLQPNLGKDTTKNPLPPNIVTPGDRGSAPLSIIPDYKDTTKIEYRNIVFSRDNSAKAFGAPEASSVASLEFLYIQSNPNPQNAGPLALPSTLQAGPGPAHGVRGLSSTLHETGMGHQRLEFI